MTAIAFRDGILAVDRQVSWDAITTIAKKYHKVKIPGFGVCCVGGNSTSLRIRVCL